MKFKRKVLFAAVAAVMASSAMAGDRYVFIGHSPHSDSWWNTINLNLTKSIHYVFSIWYV